MTFADTKDIDMRNNIIYETLPYANALPTGGNNDARCVLAEDGVTFTTRDNNLYFQADPDQPFSGSDPSGPEGWDNFMPDWEAWKSKTGYDLSSPAPQDPLFVDSANSDFRLQEGSPAIGAGAAIPLMTSDILGQPRDLDHPTIGAYEFALVSGDLNGDRQISIADAIIALKASADVDSAELRSDYLSSGADVNNGKAGLEEAVFVLQKVAGLR